MYPRFGTLTFIAPYGLMLVIALLACWFYARRRAPRFGVDPSHADLAMPFVFALGMLGSQLLAALVSVDDRLFVGAATAHLQISLFALLLFAVPAVYLYSRLSGLSPGRMLDLFALPALVCLMLARLGCYMAGCCWGDLAQRSPQLATIHEPAVANQVFTLPWLAGQGFLGAVSFPAGSFAWRQHRELGLIGPQASGSLPVHPVQLYEFLLLAVLILVLRRREHRWATPGTTMLVALASYAVLRFFVEFLRADNALVLGSLTADQLICIALLAACVTLIGIRRPAASSAKQPVFDSPRPPPEKGGRH